MGKKLGLCLMFLLAGVLFAWEAQAQCTFRPAFPPLQPEEPLEMNTIVVGKLVKTIKLEKEVFVCDVDGDGVPDQIKDVQLFTEVIEKGSKIVDKRFEVATCVKDIKTASLPSCSSETILTAPPPFTNCTIQRSPAPPRDPIAMNTVVIGTLVKTIKVQKEIFRCLGPLESSIVDLSTFTEIIEKPNITATDFDVVTKRILESLCVKGLDGTVKGCALTERPLVLQ